MKLFIIIICISSCSPLLGQEFSQNDSVTDQGIFRIVEIMPTYKSDFKGFYKDLTKELNLKKDVFGSIWVNTRIDSSGTISVLEVEKSSVSPAVDSRIVSAINKLQGWTPGETHDEIISTELPVHLKIKKGKIKK